VVVALIGALWALGAFVPLARAARVVVLARDGHASLRNDPFLPADALTPLPAIASTARFDPLARVAAAPTAAPAAARAAAPTAASAAARAPAPTVRGDLARLYRTHQIDQASYATYSGDFNSALKEVKHLSPARGDELEAVVEILHGMAVSGTFTASRLPVLFLTLERNAQYWSSGPLLSYGQRVEFAGSDLVWEFYPGQGIQLQVLGSFGKADWYCKSGAMYGAQCATMLSELIPLAVQRGGGLAWEYYFNFDGGVPPWTSAMAQGTALQALADASKELDNQNYLTIAHEALPIFSTPPPTGVGVKTRLGMRYVQYSFASGAGEEVINAFLQTLVGLDDYAQASGDPVAQHLFAAGDAEAEAELPQFNTGAWSLYQPGLEDDLSYHQLVTTFLHQLCSMTTTPLYCTTAADFQSDLTTPPALRLITTNVRAHQSSDVYFQLSKISRVGIIVIRNGATVFLTSAEFPYGRHVFALPPLKQAGTYTVRLDATDLAGNYSRVADTLHASRG